MRLPAHISYQKVDNHQSKKFMDDFSSTSLENIFQARQESFVSSLEHIISEFGSKDLIQQMFHNQDSLYYLPSQLMEFIARFLHDDREKYIKQLENRLKIYQYFFGKTRSEQIEIIGKKLIGLSTKKSEKENAERKIIQILKERLNEASAIYSIKDKSPRFIKRNNRALVDQEIQSLREANNSLKKAVKSFIKNTKTTLRTTQSKIEYMLDSLLQEQSQNASQMEYASYMASHVSKENGELKKMLAKSENDLSKAKEQYNSLFELLESKKREIELSQLENSSSNASFIESEELIMYKQKLQDANQEIKSLKSQIRVNDTAQLKQSLVYAQETIKSRDHQINELQSHIKELNSQVLSLGSQLQTMTAQGTKLQFSPKKVTFSDDEQRDKFYRIEDFQDMLYERNSLADQLEKLKEIDAGKDRENQMLKQTIDQKTNENERIQAELSKKDSLVSSLTKDNSQLIDQVSKLTQINESYDPVPYVNSLSGKIEKGSSFLADNCLIDKLLDSANLDQKQKSIVLKVLNDSQNKSMKIISELEQTQNEITINSNRINTKLEEKQKQIDNLQQEISKKNSKITSIEEENIILQRKLQKKQEQMEEFKESLSNFEDIKNKLEEKMKTLNISKENEVRQQKEKLQKKESEIKILKNINNEISQKLATIQQEGKNLNSEIEVLRLKYNELLSTNEALSKDFEKMKEQTEIIKQSADEARANNINLNSKIEGIKRENQQLLTINEYNKDALSMNKELKEKIEIYKQAYHESKKAINELTNSNKQLESNNNIKREQISKQIKLIDDLQKSNDLLNREKIIIEEQLKEKNINKNKLQRLENSIKLLEDEKANLISKFKESENTINDLKGANHQLKEARSLNKSLKSQLSELSLALKQKDEELAKKDTLLFSIQASLSSLYSSNPSLLNTPLNNQMNQASARSSPSNSTKLNTLNAFQLDSPSQISSNLIDSINCLSDKLGELENSVSDKEEELMINKHKIKKLQSIYDKFGKTVSQIIENNGNDQNPKITEQGNKSNSSPSSPSKMNIVDKNNLRRILYKLKSFKEDKQNLIQKLQSENSEICLKNQAISKELNEVQSSNEEFKKREQYFLELTGDSYSFEKLPKFFDKLIQLEVSLVNILNCNRSEILKNVETLVESEAFYERTLGCSQPDDAQNLFTNAYQTYQEMEKQFGIKEPQDVIILANSSSQQDKILSKIADIFPSSSDIIKDIEIQNQTLSDINKILEHPPNIVEMVENIYSQMKTISKKIAKSENPSVSSGNTNNSEILSCISLQKQQLKKIKENFPDSNDIVSEVFNQNKLITRISELLNLPQEKIYNFIMNQHLQLKKLAEIYHNEIKDENLISFASEQNNQLQKISEVFSDFNLELENEKSNSLSKDDENYKNNKKRFIALYNQIRKQNSQIQRINEMLDFPKDLVDEVRKLIQQVNSLLDDYNKMNFLLGNTEISGANIPDKIQNMIQKNINLNQYISTLQNKLSVICPINQKSTFDIDSIISNYEEFQKDLRNKNKIIISFMSIISDEWSKNQQKNGEIANEQAAINESNIKDIQTTFDKLSKLKQEMDSILLLQNKKNVIQDKSKSSHKKNILKTLSTFIKLFKAQFNILHELSDILKCNESEIIGKLNNYIEADLIIQEQLKILDYNTQDNRSLSRRKNLSVPYDNLEDSPISRVNKLIEKMEFSDASFSLQTCEIETLNQKASKCEYILRSIQQITRTTDNPSLLKHISEIENEHILMQQILNNNNVVNQTRENQNVIKQLNLKIKELNDTNEAHQKFVQDILQEYRIYIQTKFNLNDNNNDHFNLIEMENDEKKFNTRKIKAMMNDLLNVYSQFNQLKETLSSYDDGKKEGNLIFKVKSLINELEIKENSIALLNDNLEANNQKTVYYEGIIKNIQQIAGTNDIDFLLKHIDELEAEHITIQHILNADDIINQTKENKNIINSLNDQIKELKDKNQTNQNLFKNILQEYRQYVLVKSNSARKIGNSNETQDDELNYHKIHDMMDDLLNGYSQYSKIKEILRLKESTRDITENVSEIIAFKEKLEQITGKSFMPNSLDEIVSILTNTISMLRNSQVSKSFSKTIISSPNSVNLINQIEILIHKANLCDNITKVLINENIKEHDDEIPHTILKIIKNSKSYESICSIGNFDSNFHDQVIEKIKTIIIQNNKLIKSLNISPTSNSNLIDTPIKEVDTIKKENKKLSLQVQKIHSIISKYQNSNSNKASLIESDSEMSDDIYKFNSGIFDLPDDAEGRELSSNGIVNEVQSLVHELQELLRMKNEILKLVNDHDHPIEEIKMLKLLKDKLQQILSKNTIKDITTEVLRLNKTAISAYKISKDLECPIEEIYQKIYTYKTDRENIQILNELFKCNTSQKMISIVKNLFSQLNNPEDINKEVAKIIENNKKIQEEILINQAQSKSLMSNIQVSISHINQIMETSNVEDSIQKIDLLKSNEKQLQQLLSTNNSDEIIPRVEHIVSELSKISLNLNLNPNQTGIFSPTRINITSDLQTNYLNSSLDTYLYNEGMSQAVYNMKTKLREYEKAFNQISDTLSISDISSLPKIFNELYQQANVVKSITAIFGELNIEVFDDIPHTISKIIKTSNTLSNQENQLYKLRREYDDVCNFVKQIFSIIMDGNSPKKIIFPIPFKAQEKFYQFLRSFKKRSDRNSADIRIILKKASNTGYQGKDLIEAVNSIADRAVAFERQMNVQEFHNDTISLKNINQRTMNAYDEMKEKTEQRVQNLKAKILEIQAKCSENEKNNHQALEEKEKELIAIENDLDKEKRIHHELLKVILKDNPDVNFLKVNIPTKEMDSLMQYLQ